MSDIRNVHLLLHEETLIALDLIVGFKTGQGPVRWSRSACIREALNEYIKRRPIREVGGVLVMKEPRLAGLGVNEEDGDVWSGCDAA